MPDERVGRLDIDLMLALEALLSTGNVTRAAQRLRITQPALSARLARLRIILGDRLFVPAASGRGVVPTPRAAALADDLAQSLDAMRRMLKPQGIFNPSSSRRAFTIALHDNPAVMLAPELVATVATLAPTVRLSLRLPDRARIQAQLEDGTVDIAVLPPAAADPGWIGRMLFDEDFVTAQRKGHPRGAGHLDVDAFCGLDHILISADGGGYAGIVDEVLAAGNRTRRVVASIQSYILAPLIVEASNCVCTMPRRFLERFPSTLDVFETPLQLGTFQLAAYWHSRSQGDAGHAWLRQRLVEVAAAALRP